MLNSLNGCHVLITQSQPGNQRLAQYIQQCGGQATCYPVLKAQPLPISSYKSAACHEADVLIFLSEHAVYHAAPILNQLNSIPQVIAVGPATAHALEQYGISQVIVPHTFNKNGIAELPYFDDEPKNVVVLTSQSNQKIQPSLKKLLTKKNHRVITLYTHAMIHHSLMHSMAYFRDDITYDVMTIHSASALVGLAAAVQNSPLLSSLPVCTISSSLAQIVRQSGLFQDIMASPEPTSIGISQCLQTWWQHKTTQYAL
ncbi:MAG: uroporphyrinogen-III synthase [Pseudomonadota bacterium]|nr:uroporphyrinogen-III synthase [Pseudomonadota bacterium]